MKKLLLFLTLIALICPFSGQAQTSVTGQVEEGPLSVRPTICNSGDLFFATDTFILYQCGPSNVWTLVAGGQFGYANNNSASGALTLNSPTNFFYDYTLSGNVTSMTVSSVGQVAGTIYGVKFCQPIVGGTYTYTVQWPGVFNTPPLVFTGVGACTSMAFKLNAANTWDPIVNASYYQNLEQNSAGKPQEKNLNFLPPFSIADNPGNFSSDVTFPNCVGTGVSHARGAVTDPGATPHSPLYYFDETCNWSQPPSSGGLSNPVTSPNPLDLFVDLAIGGPNPWVDIRSTGAYTTFSTTSATVTGGTPTVLLATASNFQNGEYATLYHAGAAPGVSTPTISSVVPSGNAGGVYAVNSTTGSTTYGYQVADFGLNGDLSATSSASTISTGLATLGQVGTTVSALSRSGATVTITTTSPLGMVPGQMFWLSNAVDASFNGSWMVLTSSGTTVTFVSGWDTNNGASTSTTIAGTSPNGFNIWTWFFNRVNISHDTNAITHQIYGPNCPTTCNWMGQTVLDYWDDYGTAMMAGQTRNAKVPATPPVSALNQDFTFKILSGAGTTTLLASANAGTSVAGNTVLSDDGPAIVAAAVVAHNSTTNDNTSVYIPNLSVIPQINSYTNICPGAAYCPKLIIDGTTLTTNSPLTAYQVEGWGENQAFFTFAFGKYPTIGGPGYPNLYGVSNAPRLKHIAVGTSSNNGGLGMYVISPTQATFDDTYWSSGPGSTNDCIGISAIFRVYGPASTGFNNSWTRSTFTGGICGASKYNGMNPFPSMIMTGDVPTSTSAPGGVYVRDAWFLNHGGFDLNYPSAGCVGGQTASYDHVWTQDSVVPVLDVSGQCGGLSAGLRLEDIYPADFSTPVFATYSGVNGTLMLSNVSTPAGLGNIVTGRPTDVTAVNTSSIQLGSDNQNTVQNIGLTSQNKNFALGATYNLFAIGSGQTAAPTCSVVAAGPPFTPAGTFGYTYKSQFADSGFDAGSSASTTCTSDGAHQIQVTVPAAVPGATGYIFFANGFGFTGSSLFCGTALTSGLTIIHQTNCGTSFVRQATGSATGITGNNLYGLGVILGNVPSAPTFVANQFQSFNLNNWPSFNVNSSTTYQYIGVTGGSTPGQSVCFSGTNTGAVTACTGSSSGTVNTALQYSTAFYSAAGTANTISGINSPTSPASTMQLYGASPTGGGVATQPGFFLPGISTRTVSGATDTIVASDRAQQVAYTSGGAVAVSIPAPSTSNFGSWVLQTMAVGATTPTFTPTSGTVNGGGTYPQAAGTICKWTTHDGTNYDVVCPGAASVTTTGSPASGNVAKFSGSSSITNGDLSGDVSTSGTLVTTIGANAVTSAKLAVVNTRRVCDIVIGDSSGAVVTNAQLGPQKRMCFIPAASTIQEMDIEADGGTPNAIVGYRNPAGSLVNIVSGALATGAAGINACSNTGGTTGIDGTTTCSSTLQNTTVAAGGYFELVSGTAGGTAKLVTVHIIYTLN